MNGYQLRTVKKKEQIMRATFDLICKFGIEKTSIAEISKLAKVSPVSIYNYFGNKEELVRMTLIDLMNKTMSKYEELLERMIPFQEKMEFFLRERGEMAECLSMDLVQVSSEPVVREQIEAFYKERTIPFFIKLIELGKQEGCIDPNLSMEAVLLYIQMFKEVLAGPGFMEQSSPTILQDIDRLFYYGLIGKPRVTGSEDDVESVRNEYPLNKH
ncbi:TetR/AcrR family transcriptional regulator [Paenibacillus oceani]|uniref:TetR/AcrR family transcriptional regulator n=1 Tax=Paenibacillus oceani TaxID=2772510 RepID=A0A927CAJ0_9BACL|nr:TetR/AcrR family transcriptional regulator [Paenibacillus oceani]MBD2864120.1 TetR/AcrR family transcriptional regulator [Paenibacillus oceani]